MLGKAFSLINSITEEKDGERTFLCKLSTYRGSYDPLTYFEQAKRVTMLLQYNTTTKL